jgi:hypothetical protein
LLWDLLTFRLMITPILIQIVFWLGVAVCFIQGGLTIVASFVMPASSSRSNWDARDDRFAPPDRFGPGEKIDKTAKPASTTQFSIILFATGLATIVFGPLLVRLYCELLIVIFKIHDELKISNDRQQYRT